MTGRRDGGAYPARFIDLEGRTVREMIVEGRQTVIDLPAKSRIICATPVTVSEATWPSLQMIRYRLERQDERGTLIYRRETSLWR